MNGVCPLFIFDYGAVYGTAPLLFYNNLFAKYLTGYHTAA